jgi:hypothetical protein
VKYLSKNAGRETSDLRVAAVLLFAILNIAVFLLRLVSVWHYGALFSTSGAEAIVTYPIWKAVHNLPVYGWPLSYPFSLTLYNYLFYESYGFFLRMAGVTGSGILAWGRSLTLAFAILGALAQWKLVQHYLNLRGLRSALSLVFALGLWSCASLIRGWELTMRPDMAAVALVMVALYTIVRQPRFAFAYAGGLFYLAWSFKQTVILAFVGVCLFLLFHKRWRDLFLLAAVFAALTSATLLLSTPEYRFSVLVAPGLVTEFTFAHTVREGSRAVIENAYWILASIALLLAAGARRLDHTLRLLGTVFLVALLGGLAGMSKTGGTANYMLESFVAGSALLQIAAFTAPGWLVTALLLSGCAQPAIEVTTVPSGVHFPHNSMLVGIATADEYADAVALRDRLATMKKPIFTTDDVFSLPWYSNDNHAPALAIDLKFHDATRASCQNGCVEGMLQRGEIPTVMLPSAASSTETCIPGNSSPPSAWARNASRLSSLWTKLQNELSGDSTQPNCFYSATTSDDIYRRSLNPNYKKVGEARYLDAMWSIYTLNPQAPSPGASKKQ